RKEKQQQAETAEVIDTTAEAITDNLEQPKTEKVKQRRQRRQLHKKIRLESAELQPAGDTEQAPAAVSDNTPSRVKNVGIEMAKEANSAAELESADVQSETDAQESQEGQRRNRRSPRHLRASGQRRRRIRDTRPQQDEDQVDQAVSDAITHAVEEVSDSLGEMENVVSIVERPKRRPTTGVASPEMAMGKVWPRHDKPAVHAEDTAAEDSAEATETLAAAVQAEQSAEAQAASLSGVAMPELAMAKVMPLRQPAAQSEPAQTRVEQAETAPATVAEAPETTQVSESPAIDADVSEPLVAETVTEAVAETVTEKQAEEASPQEAIESPVVAQVTAAVKQQVTASAPRGIHSVSPMTKAPAPQQVLDTTPVAIAPLRASLIQARQAGSQTATSVASAPMTKAASETQE
ncbi:MAG: ribonuclease E, partial [Photobacterium halotolerans]